MEKELQFDEFEGISKEDWIQKIEKDLKGKPYQDLKGINTSGIETEAVYTASDVSLLDEAPGSGSYRRGSKSANNQWVIDEVFSISDNHQADNKKVLDLLNRGLTGISFKGDPSATLLKGILPEYVNLCFETTSDFDFLQDAFGKEANTYPIHLHQDPIGDAALSGKWTGFGITRDIINGLSHFQLLRAYLVNGHRYHDSGGNAVSELAFSMAHAHEYLLHLMEGGMSIDQASAQIKVSLGCGVDYFTEISKIRAFRMLWAQMIEAYEPAHACSKTALIHSITSQYYSTVYDAHNNMLRATTQAMSAILGGCDILRVRPFDTAWKEGSDFSRRIARNVQLILQEESYFNRVVDPAGGSYYVEYLTDQLAQKAWEKFKKIEAKGGFLGLMTSGNLARELNEDAEEQFMRFEDKELKVLGVNLYPNPEETALDKIDILEPEKDDPELDFDPIKLIRLVGPKEEHRLNEELKEGES